MNFVLCILLLLVAQCMTMGYAVSHQCEASSVGKTFVFGIIGNVYQATSTNIRLHITPVTQVQAHIRVTAPFINMDSTYTVSVYSIINLNGSLVQLENGRQFKGIEVSSDVNVSLTVYTADGNDLTEGFLALPVDTLGSRYVAASYIPYNSSSSEILVTGIENDTDVVLNTVVDGHQGPNRTFRLQKFETYQLKLNNDPSGSEGTSNKPVAVFSGSADAQVPAGIGDYQYIVEQMIPTKYWTTKFIIPSVYPRKHFVLKFFADQDNTEIQYYNSTNNFTVYMNAHSLVELTFGTYPVVVVSNKPISVIQYGHDGDNMDGDPFMTNTQGISQFQDSYRFVTQNYHTNGRNTVAITILKNSTSGLLLNGYLISKLNAKNVLVSPPMDQYLTLFINVSYNSYYHLYHNGGEMFGAVIYGRIDTVTGYGHPLQLSFTDRDCENHVPSTKTTLVYSQTTSFTTPTYSNLTTDGGKGTWCFHCDGMTHLQFCDWVERCQTEDEVCYVQRYSRSIHANLYRSGCINRQQCNGGDGNGGCVQCCNGSFCNSEGCGDRGFQQLSRRGPLCFDCTHKGEHETCNTVQLCDANQVCMIEKYKWGEDFHNIMGCASSQVCASKRSVRGLNARHAPVCSRCCHSDFCNKNCTSVNTGVAIIG